MHGKNIVAGQRDRRFVDEKYRNPIHTLLKFVSYIKLFVSSVVVYMYFILSVASGLNENEWGNVSLANEKAHETCLSYVCWQQYRWRTSKANNFWLRILLVNLLCINQVELLCLNIQSIYNICCSKQKELAEYTKLGNIIFIRTNTKVETTYTLKWARGGDT